MFDHLRFITIFDNFPLPNQGEDISVHCFYHFSTSNVLRLRCNNTLIFLWDFSVKQFMLGNLMKTPLSKRSKHTCDKSFTFLIVKCLDYHYMQSDPIDS